MYRSGLILLQALGALSILPYPFVLVANVMSIAAPRQTLAGAMPFLLLSVYPVVWLGLYVYSWRALSRGDLYLAFGLSSIPVLACVAFVGLYLVSWGTATKSFDTPASDVRKTIEPVNPLLWTIWCTGGEHRFPRGPSVPVAQAIQTIEENPDKVNIGVPPYGTPLNLALSNLSMNLDGSPIGDSRRQEDLMRLIRTLVARGAHFAPTETSNLRQQWLLRRAMHDGPITTASENPLVWRILTRTRNGVTIFQLRPDEIPLVNKATELHGTPLYTALLQDAPDLFRELIPAGARLSPEEERDTAAATSLQLVLDKDPELKRAYFKSH